jgi:hypothetical protein
VDPTERYLFDLNGYLAVSEALSPPILAAINALMDERIASDVPVDATTHRFGDVLDWGPAVRALIDHEPILAYLDEFLGTGYRLDHDYADLIRRRSRPPRHGPGRHRDHLHGGDDPRDAPVARRRGAADALPQIRPGAAGVGRALL